MNTYRTRMNVVKDIKCKLSTFKFFRPCYFRTSELNEYIRFGFGNNNDTVLVIKNNYSITLLSIHRNKIYIRNNNHIMEELSTEIETESDFFQLRIMNDYGDITLEDIKNCQEIFNHFDKIL